MSGLFGLTPEEVQEKAGLDAQTQGLRLAQLEPGRMSVALGGTAGGLFGNAIRDAAGANPELIKASLVKKAQQDTESEGVEFGTPQYFESAAKHLAKYGLQNEALAAKKYGSELLKASTTAQLDAEKLNNERGYRKEIADAGLDEDKIAMAAMKYAKPEIALGIIQKKEDRAARVQQAKDALEAKQEALRLQMESKNLDREQRDRLAAQADETKRQLAGLQAELAKGNQEIQRLKFQTQADQQLVKQTQQLGLALEKSGLPEVDATIAAVEESLKKTPKLAEYIAGPSSGVPDILIGKATPGMKQSEVEDIRAGRLAFQKLFNITLKNRSGSAVTNQELDRLKSEFASGAFKTSAQLQRAVEQARNIINKHYQSVAAGYGKDALKAYNENLRGLGGRVVIEPSDAADNDPLGLRK